MNLEYKSHNYSFYAIAIFAVLRPIFTLSFAAELEIFGLNLLKLFGITFSYIFILISLLNLKKFRLDILTLTILLFSLYCGLSIIWGSKIEYASELILPFTIFFAIYLTQENEKQILALILLALIGYIIPVLGSGYLILMGKTISRSIYWTNLDRFTGLYLKVHTLAHAMFLYVICLAIYAYLNKNLIVNKRKLIWLFFFIGIIATYCIYKSATRTVYVGLFTFGMIFLYGRRQFLLLSIVTILAILIVLTSTKFKTIFFDVYDYIYGYVPIETVGSGRIGMWKQSFTEFEKFPFENKILGSGLGNELNKRVHLIGSSHNDFLSIMITLGIIGCFLYFTILLFTIYSIYVSELKSELKFIYLGFTISVLLMNLLSNSYLSRFELGQSFFFIIGTFYALKNGSAEVGSKALILN